MTAAVAVEPLLGAQTPRVLVRPDGVVSSAASEVIDLCDQAGLILDPWQRLCVDVLLAEDGAGNPAASIGGLIVPRQNGKGEVLIGLELGWLFLFGVPLVSHSAHLFNTSQEAFTRLLTYIDANDWLRRRVKKVSAAHGKEGITMLSGSRLKFMTRAAGAGRGFTADRQIMDEAYDLPDAQLAAAMPTLSARRGTQLIFTSSAGMAESETLRRVRRRALDGDGGRFGYLEWSMDPAGYDLDDESHWAASNPGYGYRIFRQAIEDERAMMSEPDFARERGGIWDEPTSSAAFDVVAFDRACDPAAAPQGRLVFGVDAAPDGQSAAIVAGDGTALEVVRHGEGMGWLLDESVRLCREHGGQIVVDPAGPVGAMVPRIQAAGVDVVSMTARDRNSACGGFAQALADGAVSIRPHDGLTAGISSSRRQPRGDAWSLRRAAGGSDICVVVAATAAHWGATRRSSVSLVDQIF